MLEKALLATFARWDEADYRNGIAIQVLKLLISSMFQSR
jgi:hypothetical protein